MMLFLQHWCPTLFIIVLLLCFQKSSCTQVSHTDLFSPDLDSGNSFLIINMSFILTSIAEAKILHRGAVENLFSLQLKQEFYYRTLSYFFLVWGTVSCPPSVFVLTVLFAVWRPSLKAPSSTPFLPALSTGCHMKSLDLPSLPAIRSAFWDKPELSPCDGI